MGKELNLFLELQLIPEAGTTKTEFYLDRGREGREGKGRKGKEKKGKGRGVRKM